MHLDVQDLRNFYYRNALGRAVQKTLREEIRQLWPEAKGQTVAGYGFTVPFLRPYLKDSRRVIALMPAPQGVIPWPRDLSNVSVLCEETFWPIETGHVDKLLVVQRCLWSFSVTLWWHSMATNLLFLSLRTLTAP